MALAQLPDEILHHILHQLPPDDALRSFQLVCRRFARLSAAPLVWRSHCVHGFAYWHPRHDFPTKLARPAADVDWKALYVDRRRSNVLAARLLDSIIATKVRRLDCFGRLGALGYDAKDFLLEQASTAEDAHDVLARRYEHSIRLFPLPPIVMPCPCTPPAAPAIRV